MKIILLFFLLLCTQVLSQMLSKRNDIKVFIGREVLIKPADLQFQNSTP
ncbi:hypothetical protein X975_09815, partial [Stegodyphus mimosarum]